MVQEIAFRGDTHGGTSNRCGTGLSPVQAMQPVSDAHDLQIRQLRLYLRHTRRYALMRQMAPIEP
jgi:hypothetical protein